MGIQQSTDWREEYSLLQTVTYNHSRVLHIAQPQTEYSRLSLFLEPAEKNSLIARLRKRKECDNKFLQKAIRVFQKQGGMCGNSEQIDIIWEISSPTLLDHCRYRRAKRTYFQEAEILEVVWSVAASLEQLHRIGEGHGSVDLSSIIVNRSINLKDPIFCCNEQEEYTYTNRDQTYPSPQKLREYYDVVLNLSQFYSDLFSLGVVALQMCYLEKDIRKEIYRSKQVAYLNWSINFARIQQLLRGISHPTLIQTIKILLSPEETPRKKIYEYSHQPQISCNSLKLLSQNPFSIAPEEELLSEIEPYNDFSCPRALITRPVGQNMVKGQSFDITSEPLNYSEKVVRHSTITANDTYKQPILELGDLYNEGGNLCLEPLHQIHKNQVYLKSAEFHKHHANRQANKISDEILPQYKTQRHQQQNLSGRKSSLDNFSALGETIESLSNDLKNLINKTKMQISQRKLAEPPLFSSKNSPIQGGAALRWKTVKEEDSTSQSCSKAQFVIEEYEIGTRYEGFKSSEKRNGKGKFYYSQGSVYIGEWKDNKMHGFGALTYPNGCMAYEGNWQDDEFHGRGKLFNADSTFFTGLFDYTNFNNTEGHWLTYEGEFKRGKRDGFGKLNLVNGDYYEGEFRGDKIQGQGVFYCSTRKKVQGIWRQNLLLATPYNVYSL